MSAQEDDYQVPQDALVCSSTRLTRKRVGARLAKKENEHKHFFFCHHDGSPRFAMKEAWITRIQPSHGADLYFFSAYIRKHLFWGENGDHSRLVTYLNVSIIPVSTCGTFLHALRGTKELVKR